MPLPIITNCFQVKLNWTNSNAPRDALNTLHFENTAGPNTDLDLFTDLQASVVRNMWYVVSQQAFINRVDITELDGGSATQSFQTNGTNIWQGLGGTDAVLQGACVVTERTDLRGGSHRGRIFLPWVAEDQQTNGVLNVTNVATMQTAWNGFRTAMITAGWTPTVVSPKLNVQNILTQYVVRPNMKTQRRRARR